MAAMKSTLIIGAGLSGLLLAKRLKASGQTVVILEKSRGVGGRMATRRFEGARLDHGAQFIKLKSSELPAWALHSKKWTQQNETSFFASPTGMTAIAKSLATDLDIQLEHLVTRIERNQSHWTVFVENKAMREFDQIYMTCPLPQSLQILKNSAVTYPSELDHIHYAKALVGLFVFDKSPAFLPTLLIDPTENIAIVANQQSKEVSEIPAYTFTMSASWSESRFELSEAEQLAQMVEEIKNWLGPKSKEFTPTHSQVKKWRLSHPLASATRTNQNLFCDLGRGLYLIGDAFGGGSLGGAARSAEAVPI